MGKEVKELKSTCEGIKEEIEIMKVAQDKIRSNISEKKGNEEITEKMVELMKSERGIKGNK